MVKRYKTDMYDEVIVWENGDISVKGGQTGLKVIFVKTMPQDVNCIDWVSPPTVWCSWASARD